jgi:hypothetical protein
MTEENQQKQEIPDILTLKSKEEFRRRLLLMSRALAFGLILVIAYTGYGYYQLYQFHEDKSYCYLCGYYEGKKCEQQYIEPNDYRTREEIVLEIAEYNAKKWPATRVTGGAIGNPLNINWSKITNITETIE